MFTDRYGNELIETGTVIVDDNGGSILNKTVSKTVTFKQRDKVPVVIATMQRNSDSQLIRIIEGSFVIDSITTNSVTFSVKNPSGAFGFKALINYAIIGD